MVEDARRAVTVAEARLKAAEARLAQRDETLRSGGGAGAGNAFVLSAPIAGRITEVMATLGAAYDEGAPLFKITRTDALELKVFVPAAQTAAVRGLTGVELEVPGRPDPLPLRFHHVHDPGVLDPTTRALPVQMEVENPDGRLLIGQTGTAILHTGAGSACRRSPTRLCSWKLAAGVSYTPAAAVCAALGRNRRATAIRGHQERRRRVSAW